MVPGFVQPRVEQADRRPHGGLLFFYLVFGMTHFAGGF